MFPCISVADFQHKRVCGDSTSYKITKFSTALQNFYGRLDKSFHKDGLTASVFAFHFKDFPFGGLMKVGVQKICRNF